MIINHQVNSNLWFAYAGPFVDREISAIPASKSNYPPTPQVRSERYNYNSNTHAVTVNYSTDLQNGWEGYMNGSYAHKLKMNGSES